MNLPLRKKVSAHRKRLAALDHERSIVVAELRAYEEILGEEANGARPDGAALNKSGGVKHPRISRNWRIILAHLADYKHFNAGDIILLADRLVKEEILSKTQTPDGVRAQFSIYTKKGIIIRRGGGNYCLSESIKPVLAAEFENPSRAKVGRFRLHKFGPELAGSGPKNGG